eukprot:SAG11_NODE_27008_length_338_cov_0.861925_1_plen_45_part_01
MDYLWFRGLPSLAQGGQAASAAGLKLHRTFFAARCFRKIVAGREA